MSRKPDERLSEREARAAELFLGEADREILLTLYAVRFASVAQIMTLLGVSQQVTQRRLARLYRHRYVDRQPWGFRYVYTLDALGTEFVADARGIHLEKRRQRAVSPFFLDHHLAVGDVYLALTLAAQNHDLTLTWRNEVDAADRYDVPAGPRKLEPDAILTLIGPEVRPFFAFLEVDRATESWQKWGQKVRDYNDYFLSGRFTRRWQIALRTIVLITVPDLRRLETLQAFTAERWRARLSSGPIPVGFTVHDAVTPDRVLGLPWAGLEQGQSFRLIDEESP